MKRFAVGRLAGALAFALTIVIGQVCLAHFPWLATDDQGHALLFFSESPAERDYHLPEAVAKAKVVALTEDGKATTLELPESDEEGFAGRKSAESVVSGSTLQTTFQYGIYHGTLLKYYAQHQPPIGKDAVGASEGEQLRLQASVQSTKTGMELTVTWDGKPLEGASVTIIDADEQRMDEKTDAEGKASFSTGAEGLTGFVIGHTIKDAKGELDGEAYTSESHYATLTTVFKKQAAAPAKQTAKYAPLPEAVASFGAAVSDGWLYVYSGHTGKAHAHSRENLSQDFRRLKLDGQSEWESLPMQTPLQGLAIVAHGGKIYRVGGLNALNAPGEDDDMHSVDEFCCYDPKSSEWTSLPNLPDKRSSHDAVVIGDKLYVAGGWTLEGDSGGEWLDQACVYDLSRTDGSWEKLEGVPFSRRALATAHWQGKLVVLCGMDEDHDISREVDCYDPASGEWSTLAEFPGEGMSGFGVSAWNVGGKLYASGSEGIVYRLADDGQSWTKIAELGRPRFFHRLLASSESELIILGGAPLDDEGHLTDIESIGL